MTPISSTTWSSSSRASTSPGPSRNARAAFASRFREPLPQNCKRVALDMDAGECPAGQMHDGTVART